MTDFFSIHHKNSSPNPATAGLPFEKMKDFVLGKKYTLSLVFTNAKEIKKLNKIYRNKDKTTDILSFPLSKTEGEILMDLKTAASEAKKFKRNLRNFTAFLFIHGLFHLKGMEHGSKMESKEIRCRKTFGV